MVAVGNGDELRCDPDRGALASDAAFHDVRDVEPPPDLADVRRPALERKRGGSRGHSEALHLHESVDELLGHTVAEVVRRRVAAQVGERQYGDRRESGESGRGSLRPSSLGSELACSGLMYAGVPTESPVSVSRSRPAVLTARAMPKSATIGSPWWSMMFSGLISRWMTPRPCAKSRAEATARVMRSASSSGSWPSRSRRWRRLSPST